MEYDRPEQTPTRESNFDAEFAVAAFDFYIDEWQAGRLSYEQAIENYTHDVMANFDES